MINVYKPYSTSLFIGYCSFCCSCSIVCNSIVAAATQSVYRFNSSVLISFYDRVPCSGEIHSLAQSGVLFPRSRLASSSSSRASTLNQLAQTCHCFFRRSAVLLETGFVLPTSGSFLPLTFVIQPDERIHQLFERRRQEIATADETHTQRKRRSEGEG